MIIGPALGRTKMIIRRSQESGVRGQGNRVAIASWGVSLRSIASCCEIHGRGNYVAASFVAKRDFWRHNSPVGGVREARVTRREARVKSGMGAKAVPTLAPHNSRLAPLVNLRLLHPTRVGGPKATGQIQNREDSFGAGIAEVPTLCGVKTGYEFGARVGAGILAT
jgi:hypothetical protein